MSLPDVVGGGWEAEGYTLNTPSRRLSESSATREGKPHVRFEVAGDGDQDMAEVLRHSQRKRRATGLPRLRPRRHPLTLPPDAATVSPSDRFR